MKFSFVNAAETQIQKYLIRKLIEKRLNLFCSALWVEKRVIPKGSPENSKVCSLFISKSCGRFEFGSAEDQRGLERLVYPPALSLWNWIRNCLTDEHNVDVRRCKVYYL